MKKITFLFLIIGLVASLLAACGDSPTSTAVPTVPVNTPNVPQAPQPTTAAVGAASGVPAITGASVKTPSGLEYIDEKVGDGAVATAGKTVSVHYTGYLTDGKVFDSSRTRGQPFSFPLGAGRVIKGWDEGVVGMKVGGKRRLIIPAALGYGAQGAGGTIPPNAQLIFDVELLNVG